MAYMKREDFIKKVDTLALEVRELAFSYPGDLEEPGYCLLTNVGELLLLINELHLV